MNLRKLFQNISDSHKVLTVFDIASLKEIFSKTGRNSWVYFAPYLACYSLPPGRPLYLTRKGDSFFLFQHINGKNSNRIDLVIPPSILTSDTKTYLSRIKESLDQSEMRILWVDSSDVVHLRNIYGDNIHIEKRENEYIYDPNLVFNLEGGMFRDIRKKINRVTRKAPIFFQLEKNDVPAALEVLGKWRSVQGKKNKFLLDWGYTRAALNSIGDFDTEDLMAWGLEIEKKMVGFSMAGPINQNTACFYVSKTVIGINGLSEYLRWKTFGKLRNYKLVNDASDLNIDGLKQYKRKFRPLAMNPVYTATI